MNNFLTNLNNFGYAKLDSIFDEKEKKILQEYSLKILNEEIIDYKDVPSKFINDDVELYYNKKNVFTFFKTLNRDFIGQYEELDKLFSKLFSNIKIKNYLEQILGKNYKLHTCLLRKADNYSNYMGLHTDNNFAFTMSILCNDVEKTHPTTVFIPSSHKFNYDIKNKIERLNPRLFSFLTEPSIGKIGDINCFFNKTIHGIQKSKKKQDSSSVIWLLGFHKNSDRVMRTIILPNFTRYKKKITEALDEEALKLFELNENSRVDTFPTNTLQIIDSLNMQNQNSIKESLILNFLKFVALNIYLIRKIIFFLNLKKHN